MKLVEYGHADSHKDPKAETFKEPSSKAEEHQSGEVGDGRARTRMRRALAETSRNRVNLPRWIQSGLPAKVIETNLPQSKEDTANDFKVLLEANVHLPKWMAPGRGAISEGQIPAQIGDPTDKGIIYQPT